MKNIVKIIILAVISAALAIVAEQLAAAMASAFWQREIVLESYMHFTWFLAFSAAAEEISKYWAVYFVIRDKFGFEKTMLILASLFLGFVWGIFEIGLVLFTDQKYFSALQSANPQVLFSFGSVIALHSLTAFWMGTLISKNPAPGRFKHFKVLFFPLLLHLLFNFLVIQKSDFTNWLIALSLALFFLIGISISALNHKELA